MTVRNCYRLWPRGAKDNKPGFHAPCLPAFHTTPPPPPPAATAVPSPYFSHAVSLCFPPNGRYYNAVSSLAPLHPPHPPHHRTTAPPSSTASTLPWITSPPASNTRGLQPPGAEPTSTSTSLPYPTAHRSPVKYPSCGTRSTLAPIGIPDHGDGFAVYLRWMRQRHYRRHGVMHQAAPSSAVCTRSSDDALDLHLGGDPANPLPNLQSDAQTLNTDLLGMGSGLDGVDASELGYPSEIDFIG
ncbi:hypothetical protein COCVIDRAFT_15688 [Bipolaris victoriae FI3]|uniref:Uncharacterized protein n=1 Tax=Bipolaris victoriae (strain FI3) TaxID=930091 RepID=W7ETM4_BIPV3|nr:hypothetical protein COCVIDRAFT_15688 [Bipolaris victoriae FI3]